MKKVAFVLGLLFVSVGALAQEKSIAKRSDLKGPAYKNYKPWKHKTAPIAVYMVKEEKSLKGPAYKNYKPWADNSKKEYVAVNFGDNERLKLMGPAYKNYKPWADKDNSKKEYVAINIEDNESRE